ncbi:MAG: hypothetical protein LBB93_05540 [Elusimicrobiota bacterium]|jgi:hypothetical protein|nr:hypothetical protein [Elusimicrobiota bacterium]
MKFQIAIKEVLDKIKRTLEVVATPIAALLLIWQNTTHHHTQDYTAYIIATAGIINSILAYVELFLKSHQ